MNNNVNQNVGNSTNNKSINNSSQMTNQGQVNNYNQQMNNNQNFNNQQVNPQTQTNTQNDEVSSGKLMAILSYIGILVLIPYFSEKNNSFVVYHAKQGLNLFVLEIIASFAVAFIGGILRMSYLLTSVVELAIVVFSIIGIVYAAQGEKKELPLIGSIKIIK